MNGAECLLRTLLAQGVDLCVMNPGTSEMQFVAALDRVPEMRGVLCLFEGVCSGAADGYARMLDRPAAALFHLGPGLGNGLANLHNARKARSPVVAVVGEHTTGHLLYDAPLTADVAAFAGPVSGYIETVPCPEDMCEAATRAVRASFGPPGQVATLIVPADHSWSPAGDRVQPPDCAKPGRERPDSGRISEARRILHSGPRAGLLIDGSAGRERGLAAAGRIAAATGVRVFTNRFAARTERGAGLFAPTRIPYFPEPAEEALAGLQHLILVESKPPVSFFGYPGRRSVLAPEGCNLFELASEAEDGAAALEELADGLPSVAPAPVARPELPRGAPLTLEAIGRTIGALLPDGAIISDEMISSAESVWPWLAAPRHSVLAVTGGAIGVGLPLATGAALACPDRKVVALQADGSAMYTIQALWTMARERLDVVTVILANRSYRILEIEMKRTGGGGAGERSRQMMSIGAPDLDFVKLGEAQGVASTRAATADEFIAQFRTAMKERGPRVIEALLE